MSEHLGYDKHDPAGRNGDNSRNGTRAKTVTTEVGPVTIDVPRDRGGSFEPKTVRKRQRRLHGVDAMVISLVAKGLTTGEVQAHLAEVYGAEVSKDTISRVTDAVVEQMTEWQNRPLDHVYPVIFVDAVHVKIRDGQVTNRPVYTAVGVTVHGERDILGLWIGDGGEGAKFWLQVLTEIKNRGVADVCIVVCDGLKGLPEAIETVWPAAVVPQHLPARLPQVLGRHRPRPAAGPHRPDRGRRQATIRRVRRALERPLPGHHPAVEQRLGRLRAVPGLQPRDPADLLHESINARIRRAVHARGHFPTEQAALKCLYLVIRSLDPTGTGRKRWITRWKPALNAFAITFKGRILPQEDH